jgi:hypothetical protein
MKLIDDLKNFPKMWSVWFGSISGLFSILEFVNAMGYVLPLFESRFNPGTLALMAAVSALCGVIARAIKQFYPEVDSGDTAQ